MTVQIQKFMSNCYAQNLSRQLNIFYFLPFYIKIPQYLTRTDFISIKPSLSYFKSVVDHCKNIALILQQTVKSHQIKLDTWGFREFSLKAPFIFIVIFAIKFQLLKRDSRGFSRLELFRGGLPFSDSFCLEISHLNTCQDQPCLASDIW